MVQEEFIDKVISERPCLFLMSAMDRLHVQRTILEVPRDRFGFVVLFMNALLSQLHDLVENEYIILEELN